MVKTVSNLYQMKVVITSRHNTTETRMSITNNSLTYNYTHTHTHTIVKANISVITKLTKDNHKRKKVVEGKDMAYSE